LVEETEKTHIEVLDDVEYRYRKSTMSYDEHMMNEIKTLTYYFDRQHKDEHLMEYSTEGLGDYANEELMRWTMGRDLFGKENMDLLYETDMTHYPDGIILIT
jgi:hypothetical protein